MNEAPRKTTVTLEDLLRLKRAEQPPAEFWAEFERGMRTKQLAAIVEPRPWWAPFIRVGARMSRFQLPVGATAILAITLFTIREYQPASPAPAFEPAVAETTSLATPAPAGEKAAAVEAINPPAGPSTVVASAVSDPVPAPAASDARVDQAPAATAVGVASHVTMVNSELSSARIMADNLALAQPGNTELDQMLGHPVRNVELNSTRDEPLTQISVPGDSHVARLMGGTAWLASASTGDSTLRTNEQAARHLTERRLAESDVIRRLDVGGNKVTVKF